MLLAFATLCGHPRCVLVGKQEVQTMPDDKDKESNTGCLVLFLLYPLIDALGMFVATIGPSQYGLLAFTFALLGCGCGAALGLFFSKKAMPQTYGRRNFWLIGAFTGMALPILVFFIIVSKSVH